MVEVESIVTILERQRCCDVRTPVVGLHNKRQHFFNLICEKDVAFWLLSVSVIIVIIIFVFVFLWRSKDTSSEGKTKAVISKDECDHPLQTKGFERGGVGAAAAHLHLLGLGFVSQVAQP